MLKQKFLAAITSLSVFAVSIFSPSLALADDTCMWNDFNGACVAYDEWATNAYDESSVCIWHKGESDLVCEYPDGNDGWVTEDEWDKSDEESDEEGEWDEEEDWKEEGEWNEEEEWTYYEEEDSEDSWYDEDYLENELENLADNMGYLEDAQKDLGREYKRVERLIKELNRELKDMEEEREWFEEDGWNTAPIDEYEKNLQNDKDVLEALLDDFDPISSDLSDALSEAKDAYDSATEETVNYVWLIVNKGQLVSNELDELRATINYYDTVRGFYDFNFEAELIQNDYADAGLEVSEDFLNSLDEAAAIQEEYIAAYETYWDLAEVTREIIDNIPDYDMSTLAADQGLADELWDLYDEFWDAREDMGWAQEDASYITDDLWDMWDIFDEAWEEISFGNDMQWILEDISWLREDVSLVSEAFEMLQNRISETAILKDIEDILEVVEKAFIMLDEIEAKAEDVEDPEELENLMGDMEALGEYLEPRMENVMEYLEEHGDELDLSEEDWALLDELENMGSNDAGGEKRFQEAYGQGVLDSFEGYEMSEDEMNSLIDLVTSTVMQSLSEYIDSDLAAEIMGKIIGNLEHFKADKFGEDFTNELLANGNSVYEKMGAVDLEAIEDLDSDTQKEFEEMYEAFQEAPMPEAELAKDAADFWSEVSTVIAADPTDFEMEGILKEGEALLEELQAVEYENGLALKDVPGYFDDNFEDVWYASAVMEGLGEQWDGYKDAKGNPTYTFGPSDTTLRAESLKIVLSSFGYEEGASSENWWSGWEKTGEGLDLSLVNEDLSQPISRQEVFRLIFEAGEMSSNSFQGYFPDVSANSDYAPVEALYDAAIVTGDGDSGAARLSGNLNRAEMAALIQRVMDWQDEQEFLEEDLVAYQNSGFGSFLARIGEVLRGILPANLFNQNLR